jgi:hypothetical protein
MRWAVEEGRRQGCERPERCGGGSGAAAGPGSRRRARLSAASARRRAASSGQASPQRSAQATVRSATIGLTLARAQCKPPERGIIPLSSREFSVRPSGRGPRDFDDGIRLSGPPTAPEEDVRRRGGSAPAGFLDRFNQASFGPFLAGLALQQALAPVGGLNQEG